MNKLIPLPKFSKLDSKLSFLSNVSLAVDSRGIPLGFVFGRESFISLLTKIDEEFEKKTKDPTEAYNNLAGRLIDLLEERLPLRDDFVVDLKESIVSAKKQGWVSFSEVQRALNLS